MSVPQGTPGCVFDGWVHPEDGHGVGGGGAGIHGWSSSVSDCGYFGCAQVSVSNSLLLLLPPPGPGQRLNATLSELVEAPYSALRWAMSPLTFAVAPASIGLGASLDAHKLAGKSPVRTRSQ